MKMTDIAAKIAEETGVARKDVTKVIDATFAAIREAVDAGEKVAVRGLGSFQKKERAARTTTKNGEEREVAAASYITLKPSRAAMGKEKKVGKGAKKAKAADAAA